MNLTTRSACFVLAALALTLTSSPDVTAAPFTPGNVVVYRVGDGSDSLNNRGAAVFLDEYTSSGSLVQSLAIPTSGADRLIAAGRVATEGQLTFSTNAQYLLITGYDASLAGTTNLPNSSAATINRVIGRVDVTAGTYTRTNALTDLASGGSPTGIASDDGTRFWVSGSTGGVRFVDAVGATTSTQLATTPTNVREVGIYGGQLYATTTGTSGLRIATVGTGLPTTAGQDFNNLPNLPTNGNPNGFYLADLDDSVAGVDTLYVAFAGTRAVTKYSLVNGDWVSNGNIGTNADDFRGLTAFTTGDSVTLFATRNGGTGANGGGELVTLTDASGYNGAFSGSFTQIAAAGTQTAFRGVAYIAAVPEPTALALGTLICLLGCGTWLVRRARGQVG